MPDKNSAENKDREPRSEQQGTTAPETSGSTEPTPRSGPPVGQTWRQRAWIPLLIYVVCAGGYLGAAGGRLKKHSGDNHYVYLAQNILQGRLSLVGSPPHQNDWSLVTELTLKDGRQFRGAFLKTGGTGWFKTTKGERLVIKQEMIKSRKYVYYVSFPWFPAILMLPFVAIWGMKFNDVIFTALLAAFNPVLVFWVLRRLSTLRLSPRNVGEDLWLVILFAFGTVHFYSSVMGQVWYTAHIVGVGITCLYVMAALEGRHPFWAGLCLGLGFITRTPIPFLFPLAVGEILRRNLRADPSQPFATLTAQRPELWPWIRALWPRIQWGPTIKQLGIFAAPAMAIAAAALTLNYLRFDNPFEFGHYYLNVIWVERIQRWGLFNYHFLSRNLAVMLTLMPKILSHEPFVKISWHGMSLFLSTPIFLYLIWPRRRSPIQPWLYLSVLFPMILHLLYQNSGWVQYGYRFSLDYTIMLIALLAVGGYRLGYFAKGLIIFSILVNTFGAVTFNRYWQYYWDGIFPVQ